MCKHLLRKGADPNVVNKVDKTPLHIAMDSGYMDIASLLFNYGATNEILDGNGKAPLDLATKLDKIKLERTFYCYRASKSWAHRSNSRVKSNEGFPDWELSSIKPDKVSPFDSKMNSPNNLNSLNFLFSQYQTTNNDPDYYRIESTPEDKARNFKRENRKEYQKSLVKKSMHQR
jgi:ankyrin repeat protein